MIASPRTFRLDGQKSPVRENSIGAFVRSRRKANGLKQRELAEMAGVGLRALVEIEKGKPTLRLDTLNAVLGVFGKTLGVVDAPRGGVE